MCTPVALLVAGLCVGAVSGCYCMVWYGNNSSYEDMSLAVPGDTYGWIANLSVQQFECRRRFESTKLEETFRDNSSLLETQVPSRALRATLSDGARPHRRAGAPARRGRRARPALVEWAVSEKLHSTSQRTSVTAVLSAKPAHLCVFLDHCFSIDVVNAPTFVLRGHGIYLISSEFALITRIYLVAFAVGGSLADVELALLY
eukprot:652794-Pleurochrysis_carterae.AAC.2